MPTIVGLDGQPLSGSDDPPEPGGRGHGPGGGHGAKVGTAALAFGALGVVFGDIGTSPLYAIRESFDHQELEAARVNAFGVASLAFWALVIIICVKYLALV